MDDNRTTIALAVVAPIKFTATKDGDVVTLQIDPVGNRPQTVDVPISTEAMESLDPLLDAIADGEYLSLEVVRYT